MKTEKLEKEASSTKNLGLIDSPQIALPKGGGAIKSIDEKFSVNAANGTSSFAIPLPFSSARNSFNPTLTLNYNSGIGNSSFGLGWGLSIPNITRKTDKGLPQYNDEKDVFLLSEAEDLVPFLKLNGTTNLWEEICSEKLENGITYIVNRYRPRIEGAFHRIERWQNKSNGDIHWKTTTKDNISTIYGKSKNAQIYDPNNEKNVFKWLVELSYDDKGNCVKYEYKPENKVNIPNILSEKNRLSDLSKFSNTYLERIKYGTKTPFNPKDGTLPEMMFETVFDYNKMPTLNFSNNEINNAFLQNLNNNWSCREDQFSDYRACFEVRTYRLCHRILHFHHFDTELNVENYLVHSTQLDYSFNAESGLNFIEGVTQTGYKRKPIGNGYTSKSYPPISFVYEKMGWDTSIREVSDTNLTHLPIGIDDQAYQWIDLYSEGISGVLTEQGTGFFYKSNLGYGEFSTAKLISPKPSFTGLSAGVLQIQELEANGKKFMTYQADDGAGYFEISSDDDWHNFQTFQSYPNINLKDPNVKLIDLTGDGKPDIIVSEDAVFYWYESKGIAGYDDFRIASKGWDEDKAPAIVFKDAKQAIMLADVNGDGLTDIVRVRNGDIVYWANMGYGRFSAKISMDKAPVMDTPDLFDARNIRLADINGSGTPDLIYLKPDLVNIWFNKNGNSWGDNKQINPFPKYDNTSHISIIDLLGSGTSCLVWSSPIPQNMGHSLKYIDLMAGKKPFVLIGYENNLGKKVSIEYKPSTYFYLQDKKANKPWITKLPFPVQCVIKTITEDLEYADGQQKPRLRFAQSYSYHHGYYDFKEREFRGFGRVEQLDSEDFENFRMNEVQNVVEEELHQPPIKTVTWFHTGAFFDKEKILNQFEKEYNKGLKETPLAEPLLSDLLTIDEQQEALRACKGMTLRQEVYSLDGSPKQDIPYSVAYHNCLIKLIQPKLKHKYAVFQVNESEVLTYHYERNFTDPRISHNLNLKFTDYGIVEKSASVVYGRIQNDLNLPISIQNQQRKTRIIYTKNSFTDNNFDDDDTYRLPLLYETITYELTGLTPDNPPLFGIEEVLNKFDSASVIPYQTIADEINPQKRIIEHVKTEFLDNDLLNPLPFGQFDSLGFSFQSYKLAFTPDLLNDLYGNKVTGLMVENAKFVHLSDDTVNWWVASGKSNYRRSAELDTANATNRFYQPISIEDAYQNKLELKYDSFFLQLIETTDSLNNTARAGIDYRTLQPNKLIDSNENISEAIADELGMIIATTSYGAEADGNTHGDDEIQNYIVQDVPNLADVINNPSFYLQKVSTFFYYDLFAFKNRRQPVCFVKLAREKHESDLIAPEVSKIQMSVGYSSGMGQELQTKIQAEPGEALKWKNGVLQTENTAKRWVGTGRTIINNKGNEIKKYEPFFSTTYEYEPEMALIEIGFSPILFYDPLSRVIKTINPKGTFSKVEFDAWYQQSWDENDSVLESSWYASQGSPNPAMPEPILPERRAAWLAAKHANTPTTVFLDSLGRSIYTVIDNGLWGKYASTVILDIENNEQEIRDARNNWVMKYRYDMLGQKLYQNSSNGSEKWLFNDALGQNLYIRDSRNHLFWNEYDVLHRPQKQWLLENVSNGANVDGILATLSNPNTSFKLIGWAIYGESHPAALLNNLKGKILKSYDQSGMVESPSYDFKGNAKKSIKKLTNTYDQVINWNIANPDLLLNNEAFEASSKFDALGRATEIHLPKNKGIVRPTYNEANFLERLEVFLSTQNRNVVFVENIDYNAIGQREKIEYGNKTVTRYQYDEKNYRLIKLRTTRRTQSGAIEALQDLNYTFDPVGNITEIKDDAQQTVFFNNAIVHPSTKYTYDPSYRLIQAEGREHAGQNAAVSQFDRDKSQQANGNLLTLKGDMNAMQRYRQSYEYDEVGNMLNMIHDAGNGVFQHRWTRQFEYKNTNNQLENSTLDGLTTNYAYDTHGNMLNLQQGRFNMNWDFADHLQNIDAEGGGIAHYVYDASGQRSKKVIVNGNLRKERIYLGNYEVYREFRNNSLVLERETLHIMDDKQRIALVEDRTVGNDSGSANLIRYQYSNHLGTACLELDDDPTEARIISYEEYYPFGSSAYHAVNSQTETPKRYRFTGKERDDETGLYYHGARYYAPWLCRWTATDPIGLKGGINVYVYVTNNPIMLHDPSGMKDEPGFFEIGGTGFNFLESVVNPSNPYAKGVVDNLYKRGEALANAPGAMKELYHKEGALGVGGAMVKGVGHLVTDTAQAAVDVGYHGAEAYYTGDEEAKKKVASRSLDILLNIADVVSIVDGVGAAKSGGAGMAKAVATDMKNAAEAVNGGMGGLRPALATVGGGTKVAGKTLAAAGDLATPASQLAKGGTLLMMQSKNVDGAAGPTTPPPSQGGVPVKKLPPGPAPKTVTARPKGTTPKSSWDAAATADRGMTPRAAFPRSPLHHLIPSELLKNPKIKALLEKAKINIDDFAVQLSEGDHSAIHTMKYNDVWKDFFAKNPNASQAEILGQMNKMRKDYKIDNLDIVKYTK